MNLDSAKKVFFLESRENLQRIEENLLTLLENAHDQEFINALFREVHTIKGSAGMFGYQDVTNFAHVFENLLDGVRNGEVGVSDQLVEVSLASHDYMKNLIDFAENEKAVPDEVVSEGEVLIERLKGFQSETENKEKQKAALINYESVESRKPQTSTADTSTGVENRYWHISLRFGENIFTTGLDPFSFIGYLKNIGTIVNVIPVTQQIPEFKDFNPEICYIGFELDFDADKGIDKVKIMDVFEFLTDDCTVIVLPPHSEVDHYCQMIADLPESAVQIGDILTQSGTLTKAELEEALELQSSKSTDDGENHPLLGEVMLKEKMIPETVMEAALEKQKENRAKEEQRKRSIRIDADKVDQLITLVGELVISGANIKQRIGQTDDTDLSEAVEQMARLVDDVRDSTMYIRMVPIGETFSTFKRTVHDLSRDMGKQVELVINGGDTELDKTLVEKIQDPLMHIVRNAVDHGIESPEERLAMGKKEKAVIRLNAFHESGSIVIEVSDDGKGLSRDRIYAKAVANGLVTSGQNVDDRTLWNMIMLPGFSTAEKVTDISGRGVGMDVVKKNIDSLRGVVDIESTEKQGTTIRIHLPLTLAIIDGFLVTVANQKYVFPLDMVLECTDVEFNQDDKEGGNFFTLRGEVLPYLSLGELFYGDNFKNIDKTNENRVFSHDDKNKIVIVEYARKRAGFVVDHLLGELQTVIKPLGKLFYNMHWISGATILGNGEVALIIDVPRLIEYVGNNVKLRGKK
ncbi:MAG: chemotaxis protein CheA [Spirochaetes bacterium]|nr:chemotaxis protein CheA [Spirochaetota bacterium]MBN2772553.1 chemotaxis protein CheA [Spirochaetota bacterium]